MFGFVKMRSPGVRNTGKSLLFSALFAVLFALSSLPLVSHAKSRHKSEPAAHVPEPVVATTEPQRPLPSPDALLIDTLKSLSRNDLRQAELKVNALLEAYPHFQLGHLIRGDLLLMHTKQVTSLGSGANGPADKLKDLRDEAYVRIKAIRDKPDPDLIPRSILQLREDQKQVLVVDAKKSRLYLYENVAGQPKFVSDYYVSQGKFGVNKFKEGDQRTPIGVYYITSRLAGAKLPDFYGPGALPLNYPNEWDKLNGRSGSGIWLHGVPSGSYSRPPLASDGCVVMANADFLKLSASVDVGKTPVIINESVEFVNRTKWFADKLIASRMLEEWRVDVESQNVVRINNNYSKNFKSLQGDNFSTWYAKQWSSDKSGILNVKLRDVTQFRYPGKDEMIVSTFTQDTQYPKGKISTRKRQYWMKEAAGWRIIFESQV